MSNLDSTVASRRATVDYLLEKFSYSLMNFMPADYSTRGGVEKENCPSFVKVLAGYEEELLMLTDYQILIFRHDFSDSVYY